MQNRPLRIAHLIVRLDTGGAEKSLYRLLAATKDHIDHHVICFGPRSAIGRDIEALGVPVSWLDPRRGPLALWQARRLLQQQSPLGAPHIVQGWMYLGNLLASLLAKGLDARVAWNVRSSIEDLSAEKASVRWAVRLGGLCRPQLVIYNSFAGLDSHAQFGFQRNPHAVIPNGLQLDAYAPQPEQRNAVRQTYQVGERPWVGMVTRYHPRKGVAEFLRAVKQLLDAGVAAEFFLAGGGMQADNAVLSELLDELDLRQAVSLLGEIDDVPRFLPGVDLLVIASAREGTPNILLEAMACGVYTVATAVGDVARIIKDPRRVVQPGDVRDLAGKIAAALADPADPAERIAAEHALLQSEYDIGQCVAAYQHHYEALVNG